MGIETYGSMVFSSMKQILNDVHDADVSVVTLFRKQWSHPLVRFVHEIVQNDKVFISGVESRVSKSGNPYWKSTPSTVPYKVWYSP